MKMILLENALVSWASAIKYCNDIMLGKATLSNKKSFVASLQNAIELFVKQYMLNMNDYRVACVKNIDAAGEPLKQYLLAVNLNGYFLNLLSTADMKRFYTLEFSKIKELHKELFREYFDNNPGKEIAGHLTTLQNLRNNETHFYITDTDFVSDSEFRDLYNLMIIFYEILKYYKLLPYWGEAFGEYKRFSFVHAPLSAFSYKEQLKKNAFLHNLKRNIEANIYPTGRGEESYSIAEDIITYTDAYNETDFDDIWEYVQMLLKFKMLVINDIVDEDDIDGERVQNAYREYKIKI